MTIFGLGIPHLIYVPSFMYFQQPGVTGFPGSQGPSCLVYHTTPVKLSFGILSDRSPDLTDKLGSPFDVSGHQ